MLLAEELLLLCLDPEAGRPTVGRSTLDPTLGAALLVELVLRERVSVAPPDAGRGDRGRVRLISTAPTDDAELDWVIDHLRTWTRIKASRLVQDVAGPRIVDRIADRLVEAGTLSTIAGTTVRHRTWPARDPGPAREIQGRVHAAALLGAEPTSRTTALLALLDAVGQVPAVVQAVDPQVDGTVTRERIRARLRDLAAGDSRATDVLTAARGRATGRLLDGLIGGRSGDWG